jgi:hypothetical protein
MEVPTFAKAQNEAKRLFIALDSQQHYQPESQNTHQIPRTPISVQSVMMSVPKFHPRKSSTQKIPMQKKNYGTLIFASRTLIKSRAHLLVFDS